MKRSSLLLTVGLLTFLIGVALVWGYGQLVKLVPVEDESLVLKPLMDGITHPLPDPLGRFTDGLRVTFLRTEDRDEKLYAVFRVTNESPKTVGYLSYIGHKDIVLMHTIRQGGKVIRTGPDCLTGTDFQPLLPGESLTYYVRVPDRTVPFEAGFDYEVALYGKPPSNKLEMRTAWSETIFPPPE